MQQVTVLGATGSIGQSTLDVLSRHPDRYRLFAATAYGSWQALLEICRDHQPTYAVLIDESAAKQLQSAIQTDGLTTEVLCGLDAAIMVAEHNSVDTVMAAIVGAAGLSPTLAAAAAGKRVLLANKEVLVMAGQLFMQTVKQSGAVLLPIDSEHNAIFQCLPHGYSGSPKAGVRKIILTASGGPFRTLPASQFHGITPEQACAHPNWSMGQKISVDSATLMNKGLELIEACWLFDVGPSAIDVVVHPQSIVHSMVQYVDGSVLAQMGQPDMRTPIAHALAWPERMESGVADLDLLTTARLDFEAPDLERFSCLRLAQEAIAEGQTAPAILNAANEVAVDAFLQQYIAFDEIPVVIEKTLEAVFRTEPNSLGAVQEADQMARESALALIREGRVAV